MMAQVTMSGFDGQICMKWRQMRNGQHLPCSRSIRFVLSAQFVAAGLVPRWDGGPLDLVSHAVLVGLGERHRIGWLWSG